MEGRPTRRSPVAVAVLSLLAEEPMHAYRMQQLIRYRRKDHVVNVAQRNSVYQTLDRLLRDGLVEVREVARDERRPERTVYQLTPTGATTLQAWVRDMLATPAREFPEFPVALSFLPAIPPDDAQRRLEERVEALTAALAEQDQLDESVPEGLPRLFLLEDEYRRAVLQTELDWVRGVLTDLRAGRLTWDYQWLRDVAAQTAEPPPGP